MSFFKISWFFLFPIWQLAIMLNFWKSKMLFEEGVWRTEVCHHANFCWKWSINRGNIADFWFLKMAIAANFNFWICEFYWRTGSREPTRVTLPDLVKIGKSAVVLIIWTFQYLAHLPGKDLFMAPKVMLFHPLNGLQYQRNHLWQIFGRRLWQSQKWRICID